MKNQAKTRTLITNWAINNTFQYHEPKGSTGLNSNHIFLIEPLNA